MSQRFKTVYLPGHPADDPSRRHVKIAFGKSDSSLYERVREMSSEEIRQLVGISDYQELTQYAGRNELSLNRACLRLVRDALQAQSDLRLRVMAPVFSDPLVATYRGADRELLHHWYPLLEGFPPRFVKAVLDAFCPQARTVLDPFAGAGTAPLTVARYGGTGLYCELNPVLQFVTQTKGQALQLRQAQLRRLTECIREEAFALPFRIGTCAPDNALGKTYATVFRGSRFFDDETLEDVLRLRTLCDELDAKWPLLSQVFCVAVLAALVPSSLMKRAGDLRYKTEAELRTEKMPIRQQVAQNLYQMADDLDKAEVLPGSVLFLSEDVRSLEKLPSLGVDCVITSPPYLNGTNYFRNVKLELWFLRVLRSQSDLRSWRFKAVTGGINDVTNEKCNKAYPEEVAEVVSQVASKAYDTRIPMMVGTYFSDMQDVLTIVSQHLSPGAVVVVDIGDSRYAGVHVETDEILLRIAARLGYKEIGTYVLRLRKSRDAGILTQNLLVLQHGGHAQPEVIQLGAHTSTAWLAFKKELPHQAHPYRKRNWGHPLHSLCSYQGKMKPSLAHFLVQTFVRDGGTVLDPFAGVGTIPFEACLQGKNALAFDLSPAALAITRSKLEPPDRAEVERIVGQLADYIQTGEVTDQEVASARDINFNKSLDQFYHPTTLAELLLARRFFQSLQQDTPEWSLVLACLLHILHGNRPYALSRRSHPITPFAPTGPFEYRPLVGKLRLKVVRSLAVPYPDHFRRGRVFIQDATQWWPREVEGLDAVVTSPPFFDSTRFYLANWIRLWFCGWDKEDFASKPLHFLELKQKQSMRVYEAVFRQARERLKPGGVMVLHLGRSSKCDMAGELKDIARPWFRFYDEFEESVAHTESHGIRDKGAVTGHQFLVLT